MANEVTFGYRTGVANLTFGVYTKNGVLREVGTAMTETPEDSGLYLGTPMTIDAGDMVIIREGPVIVGQGQYKPEVSASGIEAKIDIIDESVDTLVEDGGKVNNVYPAPDTTEEQEKARIYL